MCILRELVRFLPARELAAEHRIFALTLLNQSASAVFIFASVAVLAGVRGRGPDWIVLQEAVGWGVSGDAGSSQCVIVARWCFAPKH